MPDAASPSFPFPGPVRCSQTMSCIPNWIETANREPTLIERMRALPRMEDAISFAELDQLHGFRGDQTLFAGEGSDNLVLWPLVSAEAIADLETLIRQGECHIGPASLIAFIADGCLQNLPIAKRRRAYRRPVP